MTHFSFTDRTMNLVNNYFGRSALLKYTLYISHSIMTIATPDTPRERLYANLRASVAESLESNRPILHHRELVQTRRPGKDWWLI